MERGGESFVSEAVLGEFEGRLRTVLGDVVQGLEVQYQSISKQLAEKGEAISALEGKFSQFTVLEAPEAAMMGNGRIFCITCTTNMAALRDGRQLNSKFLAINGEYNSDKYLTTNWRVHVDSDMHKACVAHAEDLQRDSMTHASASALMQQAHSFVPSRSRLRYIFHVAVV